MKKFKLEIHFRNKLAISLKNPHNTLFELLVVRILTTKENILDTNPLSAVIMLRANNDIYFKKSKNASVYEGLNLYYIRV
mgnify:CR=1 FL=1